MPRSSSKGRAGDAVPRVKAAGRLRGLPPAESIVSVEEFKSPKTGKTYLAIETDEMDAYDKVKGGGGARGAKKRKKRGAGK
ncbi:MAG TPA: hypothetical protein VF611_02525 [Pyrinomonadaceae bacterium]